MVNCGMIALSTPQLDVYFEAPLPPFEKLLFAVAAEHLLTLTLILTRTRTLTRSLTLPRWRRSTC